MKNIKFLPLLFLMFLLVSCDNNMTKTIGNEDEQDICELGFESIAGDCVEISVDDGCSVGEVFDGESCILVDEETGCRTNEAIYNGECVNIDSCNTHDPQDYCFELRPLISYRNQVSDLEVNYSSSDNSLNAKVYNFIALPYDDKVCFELEYDLLQPIGEYFYFMKITGPDTHTESIIEHFVDYDKGVSSYCQSGVISDGLYNVQFGYSSYTTYTDYYDVISITSFSFRVPTMSEREKVSVTLNNIIDITHETFHTFDYEFMVNDPNDLVSSLVVHVVNERFNEEIQTIEFNDIEQYRNGDNIIINDIIIDGLTPDEDYYIIISTDYFDGVDYLNDAQIGVISYKTYRPVYLWNSSHGLYAYPTDKTITDTMVIVDFEWENSGKYIDSDTGESATMYAIVMTDNIEVFRIDIVEGMTQLEVPINVLNNTSTLLIYCSEFIENDTYGDLLSSSPIRIKEPSIRVYNSYSGTSKTINYEITLNDFRLTELLVSIYNDQTGALLNTTSCTDDCSLDSFLEYEGVIWDGVRIDIKLTGYLYSNNEVSELEYSYILF